VGMQRNLVAKLLKALSRAGVLDQVLLIGSWCASFYKPYFKNIDYSPRLMTRAIDFLLPRHPRFQQSVDLELLLRPLGFEIEFYGSGYMKLENPELIVEFLISEVGRPTDKPKAVPALHFNAQPLRHLHMLWRDPIRTMAAGVEIALPHPADYAIQKLIISSLRSKKDKAQKDREVAAEVLRALHLAGKSESVQHALRALSVREHKSALQELERLDLHFVT